MRKIEQDMIEAIRAGRDWQSGNTRVSQGGPRDECARVFLHGKLIAEIDHAINGTRWTLAGWNTPTTRSRINALARAFDWSSGVFQAKGLPYVNSHAAREGRLHNWREIGAHDWIDALN